MPRGRNFFGRGFWKAGYYGYPFPFGGGRGRGRGVCRAMYPYWAAPYVPNYPPAYPSFYGRGFYPPMYAGYGGIAPVAPNLF